MSPLQQKDEHGKLQRAVLSVINIQSAISCVKYARLKTLSSNHQDCYFGGLLIRLIAVFAASSVLATNPTVPIP